MIRKIILITAFIVCFHSLVAQTFATRQLEYLNTLMPGSLPNSTAVFRCPQFSSLPLKVEYDTTGVVSHLGFSLFSDSLKTQALTKPLYDFQERLFLEIFLQGNETKARKLLQEYTVQWSDNSQMVGAGTFFNSLENSLRLASADSVEYVMTKDSLTWTSSWQSGNSSFALRFPANDDLISGMDKKEVEIALAQQLQNFQCTRNTARPVAGNLGELQQLNRSNYVLRGEELFVKAMNSNVYFQVLYDRNYPEESIANLFNYPDRQRAKGLDLQIRQVAYGGEALTYKIKLSDFQCFIGDDYEIFTGIEKCTDTIAEFSVIYKSKWYNHYHLLYITTTPQNLFDKTEPLKAVLYTFIPNHNIKNLYKEYRKSGEFHEKLKKERE
ncbi:MAG: hypothetical protein LBN27_05210 [Prevotellaceae bacterium]|nr:hypothetical protein [Prevotellaceae bacterium]